MTCLRVGSRDLLAERSAVLSDETPAAIYPIPARRGAGRRRPAARLPAAQSNPSKADHEVNDPTFVRVIGFARRERAQRATILNPAGYRTDDPRELRLKHVMGFDVFGPDNLNVVWRALFELSEEGGSLVVGYGVIAGRRSSCTSFGAAFADATAAILNVAAEFELPLLCLGTNADGSPKHPLYLAAATPLARWERSR